MDHKISSSAHGDSRVGIELEGNSIRDGIELETTRNVWAHNLSCDHSASKGLTPGTLLILVVSWPELSHNRVALKKVYGFFSPRK